MSSRYLQNSRTLNNQRGQLNRRRFLRGLGACVALPSFASLASATSTSAIQKPPIRLAWVFVPNGTNYEKWQISGLGKKWHSETLTALGDAREHVLALSGLSQMNARSLGDGPGDHARSSASFLTGAHPRKSTDSRLGVSQSIDQAAADLVGQGTRLRSIELGVESSRVAGSCDSGYPCAYSSNISWRSGSQPMPKETSPRLAFERLFGTRDSEGKWSDQRIALRKSVLDMVADDASRLSTVLSGEDRKKLDEYLQSVRDTERTIEGANIPAPDYAFESDIPDQEISTATDRMRLMYRLMKLAFRSDSTRIATFMLANDGSDYSYQEIGVRHGHHYLSHHKRDESKIADIRKIDKHLVSEFATFVNDLQDTPEEEGSLLDNCLIVYGGGISDGNRHNHDNLPILMAGRGGGQVWTGRHLAFDHGTPLNNLFLSMLEVAGTPLESFGDSTGPLLRLETEPRDA